MELKYPEHNLEFFKDLKEKSEQLWSVTDIERDIYGFQIQKGTKWNKGLNKKQLQAFQHEMGFEFPESLRNFYKTMNGTDMLGINVYGDEGYEYAYSPVFYSYPRDVKKITELINWIYQANKTSEEKLIKQGISRIMPVYSHRFILIDTPGNPVLSMYGDDIIYWANNLSELLLIEIFGDNNYQAEFRNDQKIIPKIKFWLE
jgi:hypothetical protein